MRRLRGLALVATGAIILTGLWSFWWEPASLVVSEGTLSIPWPATTGPRIAVLTDLHVGSPFNGLDRLRDVVRRTNAARPDVICILGDLVTQGVRGGTFVPPEDIATVLADLKAPAGVFAVLGNHDGWLDHDRVARALIKNHVRVVEDTAVRIGSGQVWLPLIGRPIVPSAFGQRFAAGHIVEGGRHLYVATGVGTSIIPVRLGVRPAVPIIRIASLTHQ